MEIVLREQDKNFQERLILIEQSKEKLSEAFKGLSLEAVERLHQKSLQESLQKEESLQKIIEPLKLSLGKLDDGMHRIEKERRGEKEALQEQIKGILESERMLRQETANLVKSLRKPDVRGMWGELQLQRVVELAGLTNQCDFYQQPVGDAEEGRLRPDLIVRLPGERTIVVDAKAPFEAFLEANQAEDPHLKQEKLQDHARRLRVHIQQLSKKGYAQSFKPSPEFVVLFLPAEILFSAALQCDPTLIEMGAEHGVVLATPTTLIGLLKAVAYGWKQDKFSKCAQEISDLGHELYKRLHDMTKHFSHVGKSLNTAVDSFNKTIGSLERRVLVTARKFKELGAATDSVEIESLDFIETISRDTDLI
ncbi:MAG: DNA recombination protein RmuC [Verrucomicrobia bacterium]|nr:DNA recombination protein RmuC [Verrucomicrobiota bacterium]